MTVPAPSSSFQQKTTARLLEALRSPLPPLPSSGKKRMDRRARIIELNDQLRTTFKGGRVQMTPGVYNLDAQLRGRAFSVMARYNKFDDSGEHDSGLFIFSGYAFQWRIEYRGTDGTGLSPDPADPEKTFRVLTLYAVDDVLALTR